jgi:pimeloyl-ACP methyl ester carboxylesterase
MTRSQDLGPAIDGERRRWRPAGKGLGDVCFYAAERSRGRPVLLLHDLRVSSSAYEMRPLFECFRWRRPTYAPDLPGFGLSDRGELPYSPAFFAAVVAELGRKVRRAEVAADVVALGRGCEAAARVARDEPGVVRSLVMIEPFGLVRPWGAAIEALAARLSALVTQALASKIYAIAASRAVVSRSVRARFHGPADAGLVAYSQATARAAGARRAGVALARTGSTSADAALLYQAVTVPTLVVHDACGREALELEAFLRGRANRFAVRVSQTRGLPHFEHPRETVAAMDRFWQCVPYAAWDQAAR